MAPYKVGFDSWDVQVVDSEPPKKVSKNICSVNSEDKENRSTPNGSEFSLENVDIFDDSGVKIKNVPVNTSSSQSSDITQSTQIEQQNNVEQTVFNVDDLEISIDSNATKCPLLLSGKYFKLESKENGVTKAICMTCNVTYSASKNVTSNFVTHLKVKMNFQSDNILINFLILSVPIFRFTFLETSRDISTISE